jgi:hypothetical protein
LLALIAVSSIVAHVSCEIERIYEVADRLKNAENARVKQRTLLAVIIGAGAAIATGGFSLAATGTVRATVGVMNQDLELLIRELMIRSALRKESWQQGGKQE